MSRHLEVAIEKLKGAILQVAGVVEESVLAAVRSLEVRDQALARRVIANDTRIDQMEVDVEEECLKILALHQPLAFHLRFIIAVLKINNDLERIADLAVNIAERAVYLANHEPIAPPFELGEMARQTCWMLSNSIDALVRMDVVQAHAVRSHDDHVDALNRSAFAQVQDRCLEAPEQIERLIHWLSVARHLERIADLATNIAEDVMYMADGVIVRHKSEDFTRQSSRSAAAG